MGICMDINPYKFEAPWTAFEFAFHVLEVKANLVILSMAWLTQEDPTLFTRLTDEPDMETLSYWIQRLEPVIRKESDEEIIVVFCNRCRDGRRRNLRWNERGDRHQGRRGLGLWALGRGVKDLMIVDTNQTPFGKLINRPDEPAEAGEFLHLAEEPALEDEHDMAGYPGATSNRAENLGGGGPQSAGKRTETMARYEDAELSDPGLAEAAGAGHPMVFPSPAPEYEEISQSETEGEDCDSECQSDSESMSENGTPTCSTSDGADGATQAGDIDRS